MKNILIASLLVLTTACFRGNIHYLHEDQAVSRTISIQSRPAPVDVYIGSQFAGVSPVDLEIWFSPEAPAVISVSALNSDEIISAVELRYQSSPETITFYSDQVSAWIQDPLGKPVLAKPVEPPSIVSCILPVIYYDFDRSQIRDSETRKFDPILSLLQSDDRLSLEVHGYADERGTAEYNRELSLARAQCAADYLNQSGISNERIQVFGHGEISTIHGNGYELDYGENRIVNFQLFSVDKD